MPQSCVMGNGEGRGIYACNVMKNLYKNHACNYNRQYIWPNLPVINYNNSYDGCFIMKKYIEKIHRKLDGGKRRNVRSTEEPHKGLIRQMFPAKEPDQSREEYLRQNVILSLKYGTLVLAAFAVLRGVIVAAGANVTVSSSVDGRELPIYCVETDEKKIAISFDAAWGNEDTAKILDILKKNNVHATFFMTGGWVLG